MFEVLRTAVSSLWANKTRSMLTMLGVVIGVGAVIAMNLPAIVTPLPEC